MSIWLWGLSFFLGFMLGFLTAACLASASVADDVIERAVADEVRKRKDDDTLGIVEIVDDTTIKEVKHG